MPDYRAGQVTAPNGLTSVWLHPWSGEVLAIHRWNELDPGARAVAVIYPLHTGALGGTWLEAVMAAGGLALTLLGITGIGLWWRRNRVRRT
ncbi:PepSY domain-containing protein [Phytopseudomonas daroniae]|uniref:PepSY domain-containing protein n=1 Tax=Pseudomonadaceae TaxID=135621 RepID=UPI0034DAF552